MIRLERELPSGRRAQVRFTDRGDGDFAPDASGVAERRASLAPFGWTWLRQVHGPDVITVDRAGEGAGTQADAAATTVAAAVLSVCTADCAPVVLLGGAGVAAVHAGWRGTLEGVLDAAVAALRAIDGGPVWAVLGPCIRPAHYEFGERDLDRLVDRFGPAVRARTADGRPALDMGATVLAALEPVVDDVVDLGHDTADDRWFSSRVRADAGRQVAAVWIEP